MFGTDVTGALGFVDATNWGFVKFKQESNSTVDPRYSEHLIYCMSLMANK